MTKQEAIAYLRKRVQLDKLFAAVDPDPIADEELKEMEQSSEKEEKDLTTEENKV